MFSCDPVVDSCFSCCDLVVTVFSYLCVCGSEAFWLVVESRPSVSELVKTTETIESLSQQDVLYKNLENYAENQRGTSEMSMLDEVAAEAVALAEMQTQVRDLPTAVDSMDAETKKNPGHITKRMAVTTSDVRVPEGRPRQLDDYENTVYEG